MGKLPKRSASLIQRQHMVREWRLSGTHFTPPNVAKWPPADGLTSISGFDPMRPSAYVSFRYVNSVDRSFLSLDGF
jgi:hypothetical protein